MAVWNDLLNKFNEKYKKEIGGISTANNVDLGVGSDMFRYNLGQITKNNLYKGMGLDEMIADYLKLEASRRK